MSEIVSINYIERKPNSDKYRIVGKGVTVEFLAQFIDHPEWTVADICADFDLTPAEVYAAWSFFSDHQDEILANQETQSTRLEKLRAQHPDVDNFREQKLSKNDKES